VIERALGMRIALPAQLREALERHKQSEEIPAEYEAFRQVLVEIFNTCVTCYTMSLSHVCHMSVLCLSHDRPSHGHMSVT